MIEPLPPTANNRWTADQLRFQQWLATPSHEREPRRQDMLAREMGHHKATLSHWKQLPGWGEAVYELGRQMLQNELVPILLAQVREAKKGSLPHAQWCYELAGIWSPKQKHEYSGPDGLPFQFTFRIDRRDDDGSRSLPEPDEVNR